MALSNYSWHHTPATAVGTYWKTWTEPAINYPSTYPIPAPQPDQRLYPYPPPDIIIDHRRQVVLDARQNRLADPKLIIELSKDAKDVLIQCCCGERISLVKLLGLEAVKPIFDALSARVNALIENLKPEPKPKQEQE